MLSCTDGLKMGLERFREGVAISGCYNTIVQVQPPAEKVTVVWLREDLLQGEG